MTTRRVAVLGAGNWGTTLAHLVARNGHEVSIWTRDADQLREINVHHTSARAVPGLALAPGVRAKTEIGDALRGATLVLVVIPSQAFRQVCRLAGDHLSPEQVVVSATKGLEQGTHRRMTEIVLEETCARQVGVVAGPNIATEIAAGKPAGTVAVSHFPRAIELVREALSSDRMMVFGGDDLVGVELSTALKNIVAIAAGIATEMSVGDNAKAFLLTRGLAEMARLGSAMGARPLTFAGLAGVGDLTVTCSSPHSRNNRVGRALARGERLPDILAKLGMVAEGVHASVSAHELARIHGVETPLLEHVYRVLYEGASPQESVAELMRLPAGRDASAPPRERPRGRPDASVAGRPGPQT